MYWFERLTGFREAAYAETQKKLELDGRLLTSLVNGQRYGIGELELASLAELRARVATGPGVPGRLTLRVVKGDVRQLHQAPEYADALFQVASQFNLLEMTSPEVTPEMGVTRYQHDPTHSRLALSLQGLQLSTAIILSKSANRSAKRVRASWTGWPTSAPH